MTQEKELSTLPMGVTLINKELIKIGERVSFGGNVIIFANEQVEIGNDTMIAYNTSITTSTHKHENHPMWLERVDAPVKIGSHVWIGLNTVILPGVIIEDYAVIGAGSVIVDNVPKGAIVAGNPARIIKYRDEKIYIQPFDESLYPGKPIKEGFKDRFCKTKK